MGSKFSGIIDEVVLQKRAVIILPEHGPRFWSRSVDKTFVIIGRKQKLSLQNRLNGVFPEIQFIIEEKDGSSLTC